MLLGACIHTLHQKPLSELPATELPTKTQPAWRRNLPILMAVLAKNLGGILAAMESTRLDERRRPAMMHRRAARVYARNRLYPSSQVVGPVCHLVGCSRRGLTIATLFSELERLARLARNLGVSVESGVLNVESARDIWCWSKNGSTKVTAYTYLSTYLTWDGRQFCRGRSYRRGTAAT